MRRAVITGLGFISSIGNDRASVLSSLLELRHGFEQVTWLDNPRVAVKVLGTVKGFQVGSTEWRDWRWPEGYSFGSEILRSLAPHGLYALCACEQAVADAGLKAADLANVDTGLFTASAGSPFLLHHHLKTLDVARGERGNPMGVVSSISGTLNFNLATHFHIQGAVCGFVSACASSSHALGYALDEIRLGRQKRILVVGAEEPHAETVLPFAAMRALSINPDPGSASRPFDRRRDGFVGTGGAAALVVEEESEALARGATIYAELAGWGQAADGHSVAMSHPEGRGLIEAMKRALKDASVEPAEVDYINAHATSTPVGDKSEAFALRSVFGTVPRQPRVSSTKALTGHGLSMAGALETALCALSMREGIIPGCAHLQEPDPACEGLDLPRATLVEPTRVMLNNSSGFGGSNVCLVLKAAGASRT
jgi:3-oxoacyl-(acyl-carrier-protein) synthase